MSEKKLKASKPKALIKFTGEDKKNYAITVLDKNFCEKYLEFQGNGTEAYLEVYDTEERRRLKNGRLRNPMTAKTASVMASRKLGNDNICAYITTKLEEYGFCDTNAEKQHLFVMNQFKDLHAKNKAVELFYKLKKRGGFGELEKPAVTQNFIQVNQKIIKIVDSAENEIKKTLLEETQKEGVKQE